LHRESSTMETLEGKDSEFSIAGLAVYGVSAFIGALVVFLGQGAGNGPLAASAMIGLSIVAYALSISVAPEYRRLFLATAVGAHVTAILLYYSNPIPLPFFILERSPDGMSLNIDVVQLTLLYEYYLTRDLEKKAEAGEQAETIKTLDHGGLDSRRAPEEPR